MEFFNSFSIRQETDNSYVPDNKVDSIVREKLSLEDNEMDKPYGHFYFPESREELRGFQESISWAGLIHVIAYYSEVHYGKCSAYDIESALHWIRIKCIHLPHSTVSFIEELMKVFEEHGFYVFVNYRCEGNENEYMNLNNTRKIFKSESGLFECSYEGKLLIFYPDRLNIISEPKIKDVYRFGKIYYSPCVYHLIIPNGVTSFDNEFLRGGFVKDCVRFPKSLLSIGDQYTSGVFSETVLPDIFIPSNITVIGDSAFYNSRIKSIKFSRFIDNEYARQFKDSIIDELVIPKTMWESNGISNNFKIHCRIGHIELT